MKILVVGESCRDIFNYGFCNRLCPDAPVPVFNLIKSDENGGMAQNVYKNVLSLGARANLHTNSNWKNITKTRFVDFKTNHMFMRLDCNDNKYGRSRIKNIKWSNYDAIILSDYNKGFLREQDIEFISNHHKNTFLDTKKILGPWCKNIKYIKINNDEYEKTKHTIGLQLEEKLIITIGSDGCRYNGVIYPVSQVEIKDSSGAGDTFIAALVVNYVETEDIEKSIIFANECATKVVQRRGVSIV